MITRAPEHGLHSSSRLARAPLPLLFLIPCAMSLIAACLATRPEFSGLDARALPIFVGASGTILATMMCLLVRTIRSSESSAVKLASEMTAELRVALECQSRLTQNLAHREEAYRTLFEAVPEGVFVCDADATIQRFNQRAAEIWGRAPATGVEKYSGSGRIYLPDGTPQSYEKTALYQVLQTGETARGVEVQLERPDGTRVPVVGNFAALRNDNGQITGAIVTFMDISARKRIEQEIIEAREAAEAANRSKSAFLANMSHEIRTPMAAIIGYADLMLDPNQGQSGYQNGLQAIRRNSQHLLEVINDVLDLSKIEAGGMTVERISSELPHLAAEAISITRPKALEKGLSLSLEFSNPVPRTGLTDPLRLRQILVNLIGNAIKFTQKGSVTLRVSCDGPSSVDAVMRFEIIDTGVGMSQEELSKLFRVFSQADASTTRRFGGSGLGLVISRRFARMLGGDIAVTSQPGKGSSFTVDVRVGPVGPDDLVDGSTEAGKAETTKPTYIASADTLRDVQILLADDGVDNRSILSAFLRGAGATVETVEDGRAAVAATVRSLEENRPFAVVLMDMQMPVLDGYGASSELRRLGYREPIIALTARAMSDDRAKCISAGCTDYMSKPVDRLALISLVAGHVGRGMSTAPAGSIQPALRPTDSTAGDSSVGTLRSPLANDPQFAEVLNGFVSRLPATVADLRRLRRASDSKNLEVVSHKLRGAAGSFGFSEISAAAVFVEDQLMAGESVAAVAGHVESLIALMRRVEGYDLAAESGPPRVLAIAS